MGGDEGYSEVRRYECFCLFPLDRISRYFSAAVMTYGGSTSVGLSALWASYKGEGSGSGCVVL